MTALGEKKVNAYGRSIGKRKTNKRTSIGEQFSYRVIRMLESPAYMVLNLPERRILDRIEIELAHHGGADNGKLPLTYDDFVKYGVRRNSIAPSLRALCSLGFIEITEKGRAGNADSRKPNLFRLTYKPNANEGPTNEWQRLRNITEAKSVASVARRSIPRPVSTDGDVIRLPNIR